MSWTTVKGSEKKHRIKIGETSVRATTWVSWCYDEEPVEDSFDFGDGTENARYAECFASGELTSINVRVYATWQDAEVSDILCANHVQTDDLDARAVEQAEDNGMRFEALKQLQNQIVTRAKTYKFKGL